MSLASRLVELESTITDMKTQMKMDNSLIIGQPVSIRYWTLQDLFEKVREVTK